MNSHLYEIGKIPTFPHLLFNVYPNLIPPLKIISSDSIQEVGDYSVFVPKIFGFKISKHSNLRSRMRWLRWKSGLDNDVEDVEQVE